MTTTEHKSLPVLDGETGVFFDRPEPAVLREAIDRAGRIPFNGSTLRTNALRFSRQRFLAELRSSLQLRTAAPSSATRQIARSP